MSNTRINVTIKEFLDYFDGSLTKASISLGISRFTVGDWKRKGRIPFAKQCVIEKKTEGKLVAREEDE